ncbi:MarC family protein [Dinoroseobacter sp. PD6]|uniref:MarC family protein n=1 Tax=Dinoroseobacter sp. PD6 TaxID=3028384 RepID=UPI00237BF0F1|nr:MarC family protein [Dinoroseobacter sp. PD6]MDD9718624.1 MarC family protein [Dinoroseobacter sp. PD6]
MTSDTLAQIPWGQLFGLLFMTMGPIRAIAVFSRVGSDDADPTVKAIARRASALVAGAFVVAVVVGLGALGAWGVSFPILIGAGGVALFALSLRDLLSQPAPARQIDPSQVDASAIAFPGLFPPIAVVVPLIFATAFPGIENKLGILAMGLGLVTLNWLLMLRSKAILRAVGPVPLQLFGAVFGVLQLALSLQFMYDAALMLS